MPAEDSSSTKEFAERSHHLPVLEHSAPLQDHLAQELRNYLKGPVHTDQHHRFLYATDASIYQVAPLAVVIPQDIEDVVTTMRFAAAKGLPILARGAGTSLAGQTVNRAVVIDFSTTCNRLLSLDESQNTCRIEPGIVLDHLNQEVAARTEKRLMFGPDVATSSHANLGGMIGNNSAGAHSILYGRTVEHVQGIKAALADGTLLDLQRNAAASSKRIHELTSALQKIVLPIADQIDTEYPKLARSEGGYNLPLLLQQFRTSTPGTFEAVNLAQLLVGAEGTLAVTLEAELRLVDKPASIGLAVLSFAELDEALRLVPVILAATQPSALELLDDVVIKLAKQNRETRQFVRHLPTRETSDSIAAVLYVEYFGESASELEQRFAKLQQLLPNEVSAAFHLEPTALAQAWQLRKAAEPLVHAIPGARKPIGFVEDTAVAPSRLPEFIKRFRDIVAEFDTTASYYAHASVGCLHIRPLLNLADAGDRTSMREIARKVARLVAEFEGSFSGEHGFGRARSALLADRFSPAILDAFGQIKHLFDPENRLNPDNLINPLPITEHLRNVPEGRPLTMPAIETFFDYSGEDGFEHALQRCNGAALCRRDAPGVMCPSFRATREERHSTRGRANALRLALTGQFNPPERFADRDTLETLDLCLSCKACKSECPSNVDLAKYKAEYLAQSYKETGWIPRRTRLLGQIHRINRFGSAFAPASNWIMNLPPIQRLVQKLLHFSSERSMPAFAPSFRRWLRDYAQPIDRDAPTLILYADCFTNFQEPRIPRAAVFVLNALGYRVHAPSIPCCGRAMISQGLLVDAQQQIVKAATVLTQAVKRYNARAIICCEPSCLASLKDEWLTLKTEYDSAALHDLADLANLPEDFTAENENSNRLEHLCREAGTEDVGGEDRPCTVALHGHCHQRALGGIEPTMDVLARINSKEKHVNVQAIEATCCGMAGAFGYDANHYDLSMQIGELTLFPALRDLSTDDTILAPGTSCRQQIMAGTQRRALHPIEYLAQQLGLNNEAP